MFKKLVVGALATGIALTGGIGSASASTENTASATLTTCGNSLVTQDASGKRYQLIYHPNNIFANSYTDSSGIKWYFKGSHQKVGCSGYFGEYEGWKR